MRLPTVRFVTEGDHYRDEVKKALGGIYRAGIQSGLGTRSFV